MWPILQKALQPKIEVKSEVLLCRACLGSGRLYNMHRHGLAESYGQLVGVEVKQNSPTPQHLCEWCRCLLLKCKAFRERCRRAEVLLQNLAVSNPEITTEDISHIDRHTQRLLPPYKVSETNIMTCVEHSNTALEATEIVNIKPDFKIGDQLKYDDKKCLDVIKTGIFNKDVSEEKPVKKRVRKRVLNDTNEESSAQKRTRNVKKRVKVESIVDSSEANQTPTKQCNKRVTRKRSKTITDPVNIEIKEEVSPIANGNNINNTTGVDNFRTDDKSDDDFNDNISSEDELFYDKKEAQISIEIDSNDLSKFDIEEVVMSKEEQIAEILARKETFNYTNSTYKCDKCFKGFICDESYKGHMIRHDLSSGAHLCDVCQVRCKSEAALRAHSTAHQRKYVCKLCGVALRKLFKAKEHAKWHKGFRYRCGRCGESFARRVALLKHARSAHAAPHACADCGRAYNSRRGLKLHRRKAHLSKSKVRYECARCAAQFNSSQALQWHAGLAPPPALCDTTLSWCADCGEAFSGEQRLREHADTQHKNGAVKCHTCNKSFATKSTLAIHQHRIHLGVRLYPEYPRRTARRVRGVAPGPGADEPLLFVCEMCGKTCQSKQALETHRRTHTGERPFQCARCPKAFKQKAALNVHQMVHTGAKPYMCPQCGKSFTQSGSMKFHVKTVHLKIPTPYRDRRKKNNQELFP